MATSRTFDLIVLTKSESEHTFSSINKEEYEAVETYLKGKKVRVKNQMAEELVPATLDDDEDEEMQSVASSGEEVPKPRLGGDDDDSEEGEHSSCINQIWFSFIAQTRTSKPHPPTPVHLHLNQAQTPRLLHLHQTLAVIAKSCRRRRKRKRTTPMGRSLRRKRKHQSQQRTAVAMASLWISMRTGQSLKQRNRRQSQRTGRPAKSQRRKSRRKIELFTPLPFVHIFPLFFIPMYHLLTFVYYTILFAIAISVYPLSLI